MTQQMMAIKIDFALAVDDALVSIQKASELFLSLRNSFDGNPVLETELQIELEKSILYLKALKSGSMQIPFYTDGGAS
ncbi:hypothetical protein V6U78_07395 [Marinospirillum sp. MEB164]|uniref:Uncharacterized protein n=1 Tax=Marinospirillum alkalitolerans TaxID=3123374 RepID=A0ABW8PZQ5_9GAMM